MKARKAAKKKPPAKSKKPSSGIQAYIAEAAAGRRGVSDYNARKPGSRAL